MEAVPNKSQNPFALPAQARCFDQCQTQNADLEVSHHGQPVLAVEWISGQLCRSPQNNLVLEGEPGSEYNYSSTGFFVS